MVSGFCDRQNWFYIVLVGFLQPRLNLNQVRTQARTLPTTTGSTADRETSWTTPVMSLLQLESNQYAEWGLKRLKGRLASKPTPDSLTLKIIQNVFLYHAVLGVKRCDKEFSIANRHLEAAATYRDFVTKHAHAWLGDEGEMTDLPGWLTREMLGKTPLSQASYARLGCCVKSSINCCRCSGSGGGGSGIGRGSSGRRSSNSSRRSTAAETEQ